MTMRGVKKKALSFANFAAIERATGRNLIAQNFLILFFMIVTFILLILSAAGMTAIFETDASNFDFVLAIDTSASMAATDFQPNRLEAAKVSASEFLNYTGTDAKTGLLTFSSTSFVETQLTSDKNILLDKIEGLNVRKGGGTDIGEAITTGANMLLNSQNGRSLIILTDGQGNIGQLEEAVNYAINNLVTVHTIAIGTEGGGEIFEGSDVLLKADTSSLEGISKATNGRSYKAENNTELSKSYEEIVALQRKTVSRDLSLYLLIVALMLMTFLWGVLNTKYRTIP